MAVVIDQMEGTVEPDSGRPQPAGANDSAGKSSDPFATDRMEAEVQRIERRHARLRAD